MRVHFGLHLDGLDPAVPETSLGEARVGPLGLLEMLETDLGLPPATGHPADELARYRSCLAEADDFARFYHASFSVDPVNVARTLMGWRAAWYEAGWSGTVSQAPARLADMAAVEALARKRGCRCIGQRLQEVETALDERRTQIEELILLDLPDELPAAWQRVVDRIGYTLHLAAQPAPAADAGTDLGKVQAQLALGEADAAPRARISLAGDGTFVVLQGASPDLTAQAVAEHLRGADPARTALLAPENGVALDNALERAGLPRCGFAHRSRFRPVAQVLRLALALLWEPLDVRLLLQLLLHPIAPLPWRLRRALAEAVAVRPGMGGESWQAAIDEALAAQGAATPRPASVELGDGEAGPAVGPGAASEKAAALRRAIAFWLQAPRFPTHPGAPLAAVSERTRRLGDWLRRRSLAEVGDAPAHREALGQCRALENALRELADRGQFAISRLELNRLLNEVALPQTHPQHIQQAGSVRAAAHPGAVIDRFDEVVWWGLEAERPPLASPWSAAELEALEAAGAWRPDAQTQLRFLLRSWRRPVLNCARRFVLATHGEAGLSHPLLSHLRPRVQVWKEVALDEHLLNGRGSRLDALRLRTPALTVRPLPSPRRWWQLPVRAKVPARAWESYTSLGKLCDSPMSGCCATSPD